MPFCTRCGKEVLVTDRYCPNCGQNVEGRTGAPPPPMTARPTSQWATQQQPARSKSPTGAAILNFFFPGIGYIYVGIGRDTSDAVFGGLVFILYFIGFEGGFLADILSYTPSATTGSVSPYSALILLAFLLPFAFAYDGYRRARST